MATPAERIKEARDRDEAAAFTPPEGAEDAPETEPTEGEEAEEAETQPEPEPEPTEPAASGLNLSAEQAAEMDKALQAYVRRVGKAFHGELPPECPHCGGIGFDLFGGEPAPEFRTHDHYIGCDACDGLGMVQTGSKVQGRELEACPECQGRGFLEKLAAPSAVPDQPAEYGTPAWMGNVPPGQPT